MLWSNRVALALTASVGVFGLWATGAAAITPGWECIPVKAGKSVVSGGTGSRPSCASGSTGVLAPTYVSAGVGGKPTVEFSAVNVQVMSGAGSTAAAPNGKGNLVVGYAENPAKLSRTGSDDLIVGSGDGWTGFGEIVGGTGNRVSGPYATALGLGNFASGPESVVAGHANTASGAQASVAGGQYNVASDGWSTVAGGCANRTGPGALPAGHCSSSAQAILGGL
ncbi:MAG: hypothetical protein ACTHQQ_01315, partial [Solirubrobacteraceae bacterium]